MTDLPEGPAGVRILFVTAPADAAEGLVTSLVEARLAACGNVVPGLTSIYRWEGAVERAEEVLVVLKTREDRVEEITERIVDLHPYEVPEVLSVPVTGGSSAYMDWVLRESTPDGGAG